MVETLSTTHLYRFMHIFFNIIVVFETNKKKTLTKINFIYLELQGLVFKTGQFQTCLQYKKHYYKQNYQLSLSSFQVKIV